MDNAAVANTIKLRWAQRVVDGGNATTVKEGSFITWRVVA